VFFIGTSAGGMTTHAWTVPKIGVPAIQIDIEAETIGRNYPVKAGILGDAKTTLSAMLKLSAKVERSTWLAQVKAICKEWKDKYRPALESDAAPMRPERICAELSRHVPRTRSCSPTPGMPACGWAACTTCGGARASLRSAGHSAGVSRRPGREVRRPRRPV